MTKHQIVVLLVVLCVLALFFPIFAPHGWGYFSIGPFGLLLVILVVVLLV